MQDPLSCHRHLLSTCDTAEGPTEGSGFADTAVAAAGVCPLPGPRSPQILPCVTTSWQAGQCRRLAWGPAAPDTWVPPAFLWLVINALAMA